VYRKPGSRRVNLGKEREAHGRITRTGSVLSGGASRLDVPLGVSYEMLLENKVPWMSVEKLLYVFVVIDWN
jgi:hypothetical protein